MSQYVKIINYSIESHIATYMRYNRFMQSKLYDIEKNLMLKNI